MVLAYKPPISFSRFRAIASDENPGREWQVWFWPCSWAWTLAPTTSTRKTSPTAAVQQRAGLGTFSAIQFGAVNLGKQTAQRSAGCAGVPWLQVLHSVKAATAVVQARTCPSVRRSSWKPSTTSALGTLVANCMPRVFCCSALTAMATVHLSGACKTGFGFNTQRVTRE